MISPVPSIFKYYVSISEHKDISVLFSTVNRELQIINEWFISNMLSLNVKKPRNFQFFIKLVGEMIYHLCYQSFLLITK